MDIEGTDISQSTKRITERYDPTISLASSTASNDNKILCKKVYFGSYG
jgi:hypothetical protein